ncbi:MAG: zinc ribbon domain-containing protein [Nitrospirae bacterium]|nr:zinc ribbon domain-containing protein [Nitrospirota bacterium]
MPVYEYKCKKCKKVFEILQKITDEPLSKCGECGGEMKKLITKTSFVLKGGGWYATDYPSESRKKAMDEAKPKDSKEAKPEKKGAGAKKAAADAD